VCAAIVSNFLSIAQYRGADIERWSDQAMRYLISKTIIATAMGLVLLGGAYAASVPAVGLFVAFLHDTDPAGFARMMNAVLDGRPFAEAVTTGYQTDLQTLWLRFAQGA
jgi:hypothetical protein